MFYQQESKGTHAKLFFNSAWKNHPLLCTIFFFTDDTILSSHSSPGAPDGHFSDLTLQWCNMPPFFFFYESRGKHTLVNFKDSYGNRRDFPLEAYMSNHWLFPQTVLHRSALRVNPYILKLFATGFWFQTIIANDNSILPIYSSWISLFSPYQNTGYRQSVCYGCHRFCPPQQKRLVL